MDIKINKKLKRFLTNHKPIKVLYGGRNSGKSYGIGDIMLIKMAVEAADVYCVREFLGSTSTSVHRVFEQAIKRHELDGWLIQKDCVISPAGAKTTNAGANRNPDAMQGAQGYKYSWFDEAHRASQDSLDKLIPTIIRNPGAEVWLSANPQSSADPFSKKFIVPYLNELERCGYYEDELMMIMKINYRDNPWFGDEAEILRKHDYNSMSRAKYDWMWEGAFNDEVDGSIIKAEWFDACMDAHKLDRLKVAFKPHGAKVAAHDPSDKGKDDKGYCLRHGSIIKYVSSKGDGEVDQGCDWACELARKHGADWFVWDGDGMGTGLKRQVDLAFDGTPIKYHMFRGSLSGKGQDNAGRIYMPGGGDSNTSPKTYAETFRNNRAQYYIELARRMYNTYKCVERGEYIDPDDMISFDTDGIDNVVGLRSQLCRIPRQPNNTGLNQIMNKDEMKSNGIDSPNDADSVMMSLFAPVTQITLPPIDYEDLEIA